MIILYWKNAKLRKGGYNPPFLAFTNVVLSGKLIQFGNAIISRKIEVLVQLLNDRSFKEVDFCALLV